ncbi:DUF6397 family protein [Streptomyces sp. NPDC059378]|uniref:DUF6397 family protein n=1 Tax=Streptomyces sp. NPDC059378 TaxID=3346815 RepID=UPI0036B76D47
MSGHTITTPHVPTITTSHVPAVAAGTVATSRAARELGLRRGEFDLAVRLGRIRTVPDEGGGGARRVAHSEIERLRAAADFPEGLRAGVRVVGTREGAALMDVTAARFTRLARLGLVTPVKFYLNRYRAVVWLYLADDIRQFAAKEEHRWLLTGRTPEALRDRLRAGVDLRPRNWRARQLEFLLRQADGPWQRAGALAALLAPDQIAETVTDPRERARVDRFCPDPPAQGAPGSPTARIAETIAMAADPDEIRRLRADLTRAVEQARRHRPVPRPAPHGTADADRRTPRREVRSAATHVPDRPERTRGFLSRLCRRSP